MKKQSGFTLIELVMVIVILGILAAAALPKFVNLKGDAELAAVQGIAGSISSGNTINYALRSLRGTGSALASGVAITDCSQGGTLLEGGLPAGYTITAAAVAAGVTKSNCSISRDGAAVAASAVFSVTGIL